MADTTAGAIENAPTDDQRTTFRVAANGHIDAVVIDRFNKPIEKLIDPQPLNSSGGGLAIGTRSAVKPGSILRITIQATGPDSQPHEPVYVQVSDDRDWLDGQHMLHCTLVKGEIPAELIYNWRAQAA